jgi:hypothetical protein
MGPGLVTILLVKGRIENDGEQPLAVPKHLRISLRDAAGTELYATTVSPGVQTLDAGQALPFVTHISNVPDTATGLQVHLDQ